MKVYFFRGVIFIFLFLVLGKFNLAYPFEGLEAIDVRSISLGQLKALSQGLTNPAYVPFSEHKQVGVSVFNRFEMKELGTRCIFGLFPNRLIDLNCRLSTFGYDEYQLIEGQAGFAKKITQKFAIGTSVGFLTKNSILEERVQTCLFADISLFWQINEALEWALTTENLIHTRNFQPVFCFTGIKYQLVPTACILMETGFDSQKRFSVNAGIEYEMVRQLTVRGGFRNNPRMPSLGFAYRVEQWNIETAFQFHPELGVSSGISASYFF